MPTSPRQSSGPSCRNPTTASSGNPTTASNGNPTEASNGNPTAPSNGNPPTTMLCRSEVGKTPMPSAARPMWPL
ncbi:hypothetical protein MINTM011_30840 [Mycobacterium paraintracellulare]|nr:hypothetical protein MINTM011_30840 [Mycobacterium paraintracellulare]